jgi:alpha/beta hydrolase family protein
MSRRLFIVGVIISLFIPFTCSARLTRLAITQSVPLAAGVSWGNTGPYEKLTGVAYFEVDPNDPLNAVIVDLDKAPRNASGMVEFSTQVMIVKPVDMSLGNHKIFYRVNNRGNDSLLGAQTVAQVGANDIFLDVGYTIVDAGWEGDVIPAPTKLVAMLPIATHTDGTPITGTMRYEYSDRNIPLAGAFTLNLEGTAGFRSYETTDTNTADSTLTVRDSVNGPKTAIASTRWAFGTCPMGQASLMPTTTDVCLFDGFLNNKLYEIIYPAKNPTVMALGHATTRDFASFLRYETQDDAGTPNPLGPGIRRVYADGGSQTAGYLRDFIYLGFNEDEAHRKAFDGIMPEYGGTDRVFINVRFADPNTWSDEDDRHNFLQSSYPPFTYGVTTDPISGIRDGVMHRLATDPLVFQTDSGSEFWQLRGSLNVANGHGRSDPPLPPNVRLYLNSSMAHGYRTSGLTVSGVVAPGANVLCGNPTPGASTSESIRALLVAMDQWADQGTEPPPSNYPRLGDRSSGQQEGEGDEATLVTLDEARAAFPSIPGVAYPTVLNQYELLDFGPEFGKTGGILTLQPPVLGSSYEMFVPKPDKDGLDIAGIRPMQIRAPLGTTTAWNVRAPGHRNPDLCGLTGSYIPFAQTKAERLATGDSRLSLEERYQNHEGFVNAVRKAAHELVKKRFLLQVDADAFISAAESSNVLQ